MILRYIFLLGLWLLYSAHLPLYGQNWVQQGGDIDGEAAGDQSGNSVSLSSDGKTVAI